MSALRQSLIRALGINDPKPDAILLRSVANGEPDAFQALVARHGPMVLRVCRQVLGDRHEAEDAFQAVFLLLSRRANRLKRPERLAAWLFGTARRMSLNAKTSAMRRRRRESRPIPRPTRDPLDELTGRELLTALDEEIERLPEAYRLPLLLCYWQGLTQDQAARRLGWTPGSVKGRVERGRNLLGARLTKRGLAPTVLLVASLSPTIVPGELVASTAAFAVPGAIVPAAVLALTATAGTTKLLSASAMTALLVCAGLFGFAGGFASPLAPVGKTSSAAPTLAAPLTPKTEPRVDALGDPLPVGAIARLGTIRFVGDTVAFGPLGTTIYTRGGSGLHVLNSDSGRMRHSIAFPDPIDVIGVLPDGNAIIGSRDFLPLELWDVRTARKLRVFGKETEPERYTSAALSADGRRMVCGQRGGPVTIFDVATGQERFRIQSGSGSALWATAVSSDGDVVVAAEVGRKSHIRVLDGASGQETERLPVVDGFVRGLVVSPNGRLLAWSVEKRFTVWDLATRKKLHEWTVDSKYAPHEKSLTISPDGKMLAASEPHVVIVWDLIAGAESRRWATGYRSVSSLAFSPDGKRLAGAGGGTRRITIWDTVTGEEVGPSKDHTAAIHRLSFGQDGRTLATIGKEDSIIRIWDTAAGKQVRQINSRFDRLLTVGFGPDMRTVSAAGFKFVEPWNKCSIHEWDVQSGKEIGTEPYPDGIWPLSFPPSREVVFANDLKNSERILWDPKTKRELFRLDSVRDGIGYADFTPDGRRLVTGDGQGMLVVWDRQFAKLRTMAMPPAFGTPHVAIAHDGRTVAAAYGRKMLGLWEVASGQQRRQFPPIGVAYPIRLSPDGRTLAFAIEDNSLRLLDVATGVERARFDGHRGAVRAIAFSPDGRSIVTGSEDTIALIWQVPPPTDLPTDADLEQCWTDLASTDAALAFAAHWRMAAVPLKTIAFLRDRLNPHQPLDERQRQEMSWAIADLDNPQFGIREKATADIRRLGDQAAAALHEARDKSKSAELKRRVTDLLDKLDMLPPNPEILRSLRALEVLERIGSAEARRVMETVASGDPSSRITIDAKASLERMKPK